MGPRCQIWRSYKGEGNLETPRGEAVRRQRQRWEWCSHKVRGAEGCWAAGSWRTGKKHFLPRGLRPPAQEPALSTFQFGTSASTTVRKLISVTLSHSVSCRFMTAAPGSQMGLNIVLHRTSKLILYKGGTVLGWWEPGKGGCEECEMPRNERCSAETYQALSRNHDLK